MADTPPPGERPPPTLEYFWELITFDRLTEDDATAMWHFMVERAKDRPGMAAGDALDGSLDEFVGPVLEIIKRANASEKIVLIALVQGDTQAAADRMDAVVEGAGDEAALWLWRAGCLFAPTAPATARASFERLLEHSPDLHFVRVSLGRVLERLGELRQAEAAYQFVLASSDAEQDDRMAALDRLADLALARSDFDAASHLLQRRLQLSRDGDDAHDVMSTLERLGSVARDTGDLALAEQYLREALTVADSLVKCHHQPDILLSLAKIAQERTDWDAAYTLADRARAISQEHADDAGTARAFGRLATIRIHEKDFSHAEWYLTTAADLFAKSGDHGQSAFVVSRLGWLHHLQGHTTEARQHFERALARYAAAGLDEAARELRDKVAAL